MQDKETTPTLTNFGSGELRIAGVSGPVIRLDREQANRLILTARMHTVAEFIQKLPTLIGEESLLKEILVLFDRPDSSGRWNLKEKFARLETLGKECQPTDPAKVVEEVKLK